VLVYVQHGKSVQAAFFAPDGSGRLVTTCYDDLVRIWAPTAAKGATTQVRVKFRAGVESASVGLGPNPSRSAGRTQRRRHVPSLGSGGATASLTGAHTNPYGCRKSPGCESQRKILSKSWEKVTSPKKL
jgi:hypothetical protein